MFDSQEQAIFLTPKNKCAKKKGFFHLTLASVDIDGRGDRCADVPMSRILVRMKQRLAGYVD